MEYKSDNIIEYMRVLSSASGLSLAKIAEKIGDSPQGLNQKMKVGKLQKDIEYIKAFADACGYDFVFDFAKREERNEGGGAVFDNDLPFN